MEIKDIYYFSGTHWDREWYQTFRGFQGRLVKMLDELIEYMENEPKYQTFHLDGQTIVLEDYDEIAPENHERLKKLISDGRIKIGPWYNMPDEYLVSGESLIRNLMCGAKLSKKWGAKPWTVGYICDIFGHIAQMPQIFGGFGINSAVLGRGTNENDPTYFNWKSPDGSFCTVFRLEDENGYGGFSNFLESNPNCDEKKAEQYLKNEEARLNTSVMIIMDAIDHQTLRRDTLKYFDIIKKLYPKAKLHHYDLSEAFEKIGKYPLPEISGELNKTAIMPHSYLHLITNTLSSYYTHKKANDECQNLLEKVIEPMSIYSAFIKKPIRRSYINKAYKYLLQNHPHDSMCGCSIDQVHKDMVYRFDQVKEISDMLTEEFLHCDKPAEGNSGEYVLKLYNPLPFERRETVTAGIILKNDFECKYSEPFGYEEICSFKLIDKDGNEVPYGIAKNVKNYSKRTYRIRSEGGDYYEIVFEADMPAGGYCEYKLIPWKKPSRYLEKMLSGNNFAENDYIRMEISDSGKISLLDKKTNTEYKNLCGFADDGEIGDGWYHANPMNDVTVYSGVGGARTEKILNTPSRCVFRITKYIEIPSCTEKTAFGIKRSESYVKIPIVITAGLSKSARYADINIEIENIAKDHRLRLILPTNVKGTNYFAGQTYYCCERKVGIDYKTADWTEHEQYEKQMNGIVGKRGENGNGIAFVSANGLHECAAHENGDIYVTLLRAFEKTVMTMGENGGQLLGKLSYSFLLVPTDSEVTYSKLIKLQDMLSVKPLTSFTEVKKGYKPIEKSYFGIDGENISLSIIKQPEDTEDNAVILRVFNSSNEASDGKIIFEKEIGKAFETDFNEVNQNEIPANGNILPVNLTPWKIKTYRIILK